MVDVRIVRGDSLEVLRELPEESVHAVVTDPPYNLGFMGRDWDSKGGPLAFQRWCEVWGTEALRVLRPGGYLLSFGGTRTYHRLAAGLEDAGFEVRDSLAWLYGSGFPKSHDVSKAIDKAAGAEREVIAERDPHTASAGWRQLEGREDRLTPPPITAPATDAAREWQGWGTALKPAHEPIVVARKPLEGTVAANVLAYGTGALHVDACRVGTERQVNPAGSLGKNGVYGRMERNDSSTVAEGRWPSNVLLGCPCPTEDEHDPDCPAALLEGASRFFLRVPLDDPEYDGPRVHYSAKASKREREAGLDDLPAGNLHRTNPGGYEADPKWAPVERKNVHPTVKPVGLMRWLVRLVTPPGGTVLDPFLGSGTTGIAAALEGFDFVGVELDATYAEIAARRVAHWAPDALVDLDLRPTEASEEAA